MNNPENKETELRPLFPPEDTRAFEALFLDMYPALHQFVWRMLGNERDAKDIVSDIFLQLLEGGTMLSGIQNVRAYLYTLARNRAINHLKKTAATEQREQKGASESQRLGTEVDPLQALLDAETMRLLHNAVSLLPTETAKVVKLSLDGLTTSEIAATLHVSASTVSHQKARALRLLKQQLSPKIILALTFLSN